MGNFFQVLSHYKTSAILISSLWVLHESYCCFAFLGSLFPPCMLLNYSKFKFTYNFSSQHSHEIKDPLVKDKSMLSHGSSKRERI